MGVGCVDKAIVAHNGQVVDIVIYLGSPRLPVGWFKCAGRGFSDQGCDAIVTQVALGPDNVSAPHFRTLAGAIHVDGCDMGAHGDRNAVGSPRNQPVAAEQRTTNVGKRVTVVTFGAESSLQQSDLWNLKAAGQSSRSGSFVVRTGSSERGSASIGIGLGKLLDRIVRGLLEPDDPVLLANLNRSGRAAELVLAPKQFELTNPRDFVIGFGRVSGVRTNPSTGSIFLNFSTAHSSVMVTAQQAEQLYRDSGLRVSDLTSYLVMGFGKVAPGREVTHGHKSWYLRLEKENYLAWHLGDGITEWGKFEV